MPLWLLTTLQRGVGRWAIAHVFCSNMPKWIASFVDRFFKLILTFIFQSPITFTSARLVDTSVVSVDEAELWWCVCRSSFWYQSMYYFLFLCSGISCTSRTSSMMQVIAPKFDQLSEAYPNSVFIKVCTNLCFAFANVKSPGCLSSLMLTRHVSFLCYSSIILHLRIYTGDRRCYTRCIQIDEARGSSICTLVSLF